MARKNLRIVEAAQLVHCKLSGLVTEAAWTDWTPQQILPYMEIALDTFGPNRLMFGSDWPVLLLASSYSRWVRLVKQFLLTLSLPEREQVMGLTALMSTVSRFTAAVNAGFGETWIPVSARSYGLFFLSTGRRTDGLCKK